MGTDLKYKVLIIDDDENAVATMKSQISVLYEVMTAYGGKEALQILQTKNWQPDIILLDIKMPDMDGYSVLEHIRTIDEYKVTPVVFLTGMTDESYEYKGLQMDAVDYLKKPIAGRILLTRIQHYLDLHTSAQHKGILDMDRINKLNDSLTERELDVANLMAEFRSDREISDILHLSVPYVKKLVGSVKEKMGLEKRGDIRTFFK